MPADVVHPSEPREQLQQARDELRRRQRAGQPCRAEPLFDLYPSLAQEVHLALELIGEEVRLRREAGENPDAEELTGRFPQWRDWLAILNLGNPEASATPLGETARWTHAEKSAVPAQARPDGESYLGRQVGRYRVKGILGKGGFGTVYLGHDDDLDREVAIKVPHQQRMRGPEDVQLYLQEARMVARLDHPHIVPVYDYGTQDGLPFLVSKFIQGSNLAARMNQARLGMTDTATLVAAIAEALHYAHGRGLFHRDVKPGNILLDTAGKPYLTDFGLALREEDFGKGATFAGTPTYMSPEQARGEGHRVDGRSDVFSLGVVFYELLTGRRPFRAESKEELLEQIARAEVRPPRQIDDCIPRELERICLKALSKPASQRYTTARDMAEDLRLFLASPVSVVATIASAAAAMPAPPTPAPASTPSTSQPDVQVIPKGLRSFDDRDTYFFLELLPGPRDREGLPESLRFWKTRIEEMDAERTFPVGLLCGPSGCGKSSLIKAGLLPRLAAHVHTVYVEATGAGTETRLLKGLQKRCAGLPAHKGLAAAVAALRRGTGLQTGQKILLVLDQFEQWLHGCPEEQREELVQALRQCNGGRVQCLILVRDDFWMATSRFLRELEVPLREGDNAATVDLFDTRHARKVLTLFGRALGALPGRETKLSAEQSRFIEQAVEGLAQEGKVIPVRLALFAEMVKGRDWAPATLKAVGGMEGVGVTFLEEAFASPTAPPAHRHHQAAARAVLKALLPEQGTDIRGTMRSRQELQQAAGYTDRPVDFEELLGILDRELRLISPSDPEGTDSVSGRERAVLQGQFYQLTHDYLVPAIRDWLTRKQRATLRGRTQLRLAELAALWKDRPHRRHLPSWLEYARIRLLTRRRDWAPLEQKMMRASRRHYAVRVAVLVAIMAAMGWAVWDYLSQLKARALVEHLATAQPADVPAILSKMAPQRRQIEPVLREAATAPENQGAQRQLRLSMGLAAWDTHSAESLYQALFSAEPQEFIVIRGVLAPLQDALIEKLWAELAHGANDPQRRFRAACALAGYASEDPRWPQYSGLVVQRLLLTNAILRQSWADALEPVGKRLLPALAACLEEGRWGDSHRLAITELYRRFSQGAHEDTLAPLEARLSGLEGRAARGGTTSERAKHMANIGALLAALGRPQKVWPYLIHTPDPTCRSYLIERLATAGVDPMMLMDRLGKEPDPSARQALVLALGGFPPQGLAGAAEMLLELYENDPDPGLHAAAGWVLRQWSRKGQVQEIDEKLATGSVVRNRHWYVSTQGPTLMIMPRDQTGHRFAIASTEVSVRQFRMFRKDQPIDEKFLLSLDCPVHKVTWYDAAEYCNWLSKQDGIPEEQWCYVRGKNGKLEMVADYQRKTGYRLPTEAEWEFACRAGAQTPWAWGEADDELTSSYARWAGNSVSEGMRRPCAVGSLKPNDWGLFDMHGNLDEWCQEWAGRRPGAPMIFGRDIDCIVRGGDFDSPVQRMTCTWNQITGRTYGNPFTGFRPVRTLLP